MPKSKKKVVNPKATINEVRNLLSPSGAPVKLSFDFSYPGWLRGTRNKEFTNMLRDSEEFAKSIVFILNKLIPIITGNWDSIKNNPGYQFRHCHAVPQEKIELVRKIEKELHGNNLLDPEAEESIRYWQIGFEDIRLFVLYNYSANIMFPVFIDYHHLIHSSEKHNQRDTDALNFCPVTSLF